MLLTDKKQQTDAAGTKGQRVLQAQRILEKSKLQRHTSVWLWSGLGRGYIKGYEGPLGEMGVCTLVLGIWRLDCMCVKTHPCVHLTWVRFIHKLHSVK